MYLVRHGQSHFNVHFTKTGRDPGIRDPDLTEIGQAQARDAGLALADRGITQIVASPYRRAVHTATIIADIIGGEVVIERLVGERSVFACDLGSAPSDLATTWPAWRFDHLEDEWWPAQEESEAQLAERCRRFRSATDDLADRDGLLVVSHWGFILGLTGLPVGNGTIVRYQVRPRTEAAVVHPV